MSKSISIVVADDHPLFRDGVIRTLQSRPNMDVLGEAASADEAVHRVADCKPDIVLLDISMPGSGIEAARRISLLKFPPRIVMLTVSEAEDDIIAALKAGAHGYVLKGVGADELVSVVRSVYEGQSYIPPALAAQVLMAMNNPKPESQIERSADRTPCLQGKPKSCGLSLSAKATRRWVLPLIFRRKP